MHMKNPISDLSPLMEWVPNIPFYYKEDPLIEGVELDVSGIKLGEIEFEKGINVIENIIASKLTARNCGLKNTELDMFQVRLQFLDVSGNPIESIDSLYMLKFLKDVIAKETLISEKRLPSYTKLLASPGTYGISTTWKMHGLEGFFS